MDVNSSNQPLVRLRMVSHEDLRNGLPWRREPAVDTVLLKKHIQKVDIAD
jgi:hypothetical protein